MRPSGETATSWGTRSVGSFAKHFLGCRVEQSQIEIRLADDGERIGPASGAYAHIASTMPNKNVFRKLHVEHLPRTIRSTSRVAGMR